MHQINFAEYFLSALNLLHTIFMLTQLSYSFTTSFNILEGNLKSSVWSKLNNFLVIGRIKEQSQKGHMGPNTTKSTSVVPNMIEQQLKFVSILSSSL